MDSLNPIGLAVAPINLGDTTTVPLEGLGALVWSSITNNVLVWNGTQWGSIAGSAGATSTIGQGVITFGVNGNLFEASLVITGQAGILSTSFVNANILVAGSTGSPGHMADEHAFEPINVTAGAIVAGTGFTIFATCPTPLFGAYNVEWFWR